MNQISTKSNELHYINTHGMQDINFGLGESESNRIISADLLGAKLRIEQMLQTLAATCSKRSSSVTDSDKKNILANVAWINNKIETEDNSLFNQFLRIFCCCFGLGSEIGTITVPEAISNYKDPRLDRSERTPLIQKNRNSDCEAKAKVLRRHERA